MSRARVNVTSKSGGIVTSGEPIFRRKLRPGKRLKDRDSALVDLCRGRAVVHVGCVDWPFADEKLATGDHLHAKLTQVSQRLTGVDIDRAGLQTLRHSIGGDYRCMDLSDIGLKHEPDPLSLFGFEPDVYIVGDVVEHLHDPVALLSGLSAVAHKSAARVVVTTPNCLAARNSINTAIGVELMHPDHLLVHSPTTLSQTLARSGLAVTEWAYYSVTTGDDLPHRLYDRLCYLAGGLRPAWSDGLFAVCTSTTTDKPDSTNTT